MNKHIEIERKFLAKDNSYILKLIADTKPLHLTQAYLYTSPVIRIRKEEDEYYLTYKGKGNIIKEEYNLPIDEASFNHLLKKCDGNIIKKKRYRLAISDTLTAEIDIFEDKFAGLILIEVEFPSAETADNFNPPDWFAEDVSEDKRYHNAYMSTMDL